MTQCKTKHNVIMLLILFDIYSIEISTKRIFFKRYFCKYMLILNLMQQYDFKQAVAGERKN